MSVALLRGGSGREVKLICQCNADHVNQYIIHFDHSLWYIQHTTYNYMMCDTSRTNELLEHVQKPIWNQNIYRDYRAVTEINHWCV